MGVGALTMLKLGVENLHQINSGLDTVESVPVTVHFIGLELDLRMDQISRMPSLGVGMTKQAIECS